MISPTRLIGTARVATGVRPGGFSSMRETSRSPNTVSSRVRGIGVADMAIRCAASPLACSRLRSLTPKRCCSSMTVSARAWKATSSWKSAWVPTATAAEPLAKAASFSARAAPLSRPVSRMALIPWLASGAARVS